MNRPIRRLAPLLAACSLAACAVGPNTSYVAALSAPTDAQVLASSTRRATPSRPFWPTACGNGALRWPPDRRRPEGIPCGIG
jgi:hypothetical protein